MNSSTPLPDSRALEDLPDGILQSALRVLRDIRGATTCGKLYGPRFSIERMAALEELNERGFIHARRLDTGHVHVVPAVASSAIRRELRPDVRALVDRHVAAFPTSAEPNEWRRYYNFKCELGAACGWDAPAGQYDGNEYDRGIRAFCDGVGL